MMAVLSTRAAMRPILLTILAARLFSCVLTAAETTGLRVVDAQERAVPNAEVQIQSIGGRPAMSLSTNADGTASVTVSPPFEILVRAEGFDPARRRVDEPLAGGVTIQLRPAMLRTSVEVAVRDEPAPVVAAI